MCGSLVTRWSSGVALDQGLSEWHPVGYSAGGYLYRRVPNGGPLSDESDESDRSDDVIDGWVVTVASHLSF